MNELMKNKEIKFRNVLVIDDNGQQLGIMDTLTAIYKAQNKGLDLVCVSPDAPTPVCKFMDYGKYRFDTLKREKQNKKNQKSNDVSEIQLTYTIQEHDMQVKAKTCKRLIEEKGNQVRVVLRLRGREVTLEEFAREKMKHFVELCEEFAKVKKDIFTEGRDIKVILERKEKK